MFEYVWLMMLAIVYLIWAYYSIENIIACIKHKCLYTLENYSLAYIVIHITVTFLASLAVFLVQEG